MNQFFVHHVTRGYKYGFLALASLCLGVMMLLVSVYRENRRLRLTLATEPNGRRSAMPETGEVRARQAQPKGPMEIVRARLTKAEIEPKLRQIIQSRLWRRDRVETRRIFGTIDPKDMATAVEIVDREAMGEAQRTLRIDLLNAWAKMDPAAAAAWLTRFPATEMQRGERAVISDIWSQTDPEAALAFAGPTPTAFRNLTLRAPEEAAQKALAIHTGGDDRAVSIETVAKTWFENDPKAAWKWASELPDPQDCFFGVRPLIGQLAEVDPASVAGYLASRRLPDPFDSLAQDFASQWARVDPASAAAWAASLPANSGLRGDATIQIAREWAADDPKAAATWIESLPKGREHETATQVFVNVMLNYDPAMAADWAVRLTDRNMRGDAIASVALRWLHTDPPAAAAWLAQIDVPENARTRLSAEGFPNVSGGVQMAP